MSSSNTRFESLALGAASGFIVWITAEHLAGGGLPLILLPVLGLSITYARWSRREANASGRVDGL